MLIGISAYYHVAIVGDHRSSLLVVAHRRDEQAPRAQPQKGIGNVAPHAAQRRLHGPGVR